MFNRQQRDKLNQLSESLYGVSSRWQKLISDPKFKRVTEVVDEPEAQTYVQFQRKAGDKNGKGADARPGTRMKTETALARGLIDKDYKPAVVKSTVTRALTYEEIVEALEASLDAALISSMNTEGQSLVFAQQLLDKKLGYHISLVKTAENKASTEELLTLCSEDVKKVVEELIIDATGEKEPQVPGIPIAADKFLTDLTFISKHADAAREEIGVHYDSARESHKTNLKKMREYDALRARLSTTPFNPKRNTRKATKANVAGTKGKAPEAPAANPASTEGATETASNP